MKTYAHNKLARRDYDIEETLLAGLVLLGHEVKSVRSGNISLKGSYVTINQSEAWLINAHIGQYQHADLDGYDPTQTRKLLLKRSEISKIQTSRQNGRTAVPLRVIAKGPFLKLEIGIGRGKKAYDKRQTIRERDEKISVQKAIKNQRFE